MKTGKHCHPIRNCVVTFHLLEDEDGLVLIDAGFVGGVRALERFLKSHGYAFSDLRALILSHGHLDHVLNVSHLRKRSSLSVFAPAADRAQVMGKAKQRGWNRISGLAEAFGRRVFSFQAPQVDHWFGAGDILPFWGGLEVISLPGAHGGALRISCAPEKIAFCG